MKGNTTSGAAENAAAEGNDDVEFIRSAPTAMNPPPPPRDPRSASILSDAARDLRNESPIFFQDSRHGTREPTVGPQLPWPAQSRHSVRSESPMFCDSRQQTVEPQGPSEAFSRPPLPAAITEAIRQLPVSLPAPSLTPSPIPAPATISLPSAVRAPALLALPTRDPLALPASAPLALSAPAPARVPSTAPTPVPTPSPAPEPAQTASPTPAAASTLSPQPGPEANGAVEPPDNHEFAHLVTMLERANASVPSEDAASSPAPSSRAASEASEAPEQPRPQKRQMKPQNRLDIFVNAESSRSSQSRRGGPKKRPAPAKQTGKRKRVPQIEEEEPEEEGGANNHEAVPDDGGDDEGSDEDEMPFRSWKNQASQAPLGLPSTKQGKNNRARGRGSTPGSSDIDPVSMDMLEMPTRNDFVYGYSRLDPKRFKWGPKKEEESRIGRPPKTAPHPWVNDPTDDSEDLASRLGLPKLHTPRTLPPPSSSSMPPPPTPLPPVTVTRTAKPKKKLKNLMDLAAEVRECIWRHLLVSDKAILVHGKWEKVCRPRRLRNGSDEDLTRLELHPAILSTCKRIFWEAAGVLYGENTFRYRMRDLLAEGPAASVTEQPSANAEGSLFVNEMGEDEDVGSNDSDYVDEEEQTVHRRSTRSKKRRRPNDDDSSDSSSSSSSSSSDDDDDDDFSQARFEPGTINIEKYLPLIRHIAVEIEQNRTSPIVMESVANAIKVFSDRVSSPSKHIRSKKQPNIHTLKVIIHPKITDESQDCFTFTDFFTANSPIVAAMRALRSQYIHINIMSVFLNSNLKNRRLVVDQRPQRAFAFQQDRARGGSPISQWDMPKRAAMRRAISRSSKVLSELDQHIRACCEEYTAGQMPFESPYAWFDWDIEEDEYEYMF